MKTSLSILSLCLLLNGCSFTSDSYRGSGTDELPKSDCEACKKEPFYVEGKWVRN